MSTLSDKAQQIADTLEMMSKGKWSLDIHHATSVDLLAENGQGIHLFVDTYRNGNKVSISGVYPTRKWDNSSYLNHHQHDIPSIGVSLTKDTKQIVKDILRRFWEPYQKAWEIAKQEEVKHLDKVAFIKEATDKLSVAWDGEGRRTRNSYDRDPTQGTVIFRRMQSPSGNLEVTAYRKEVSVEIRGMPVEMAVKLGEYFNSLVLPPGGME